MSTDRAALDSREYARAAAGDPAFAWLVDVYGRDADNDADRGRAFAACHRDDVAFVPERNGWRRFTAGRWHAADDATVANLACEDADTDAARARELPLTGLSKVRVSDYTRYRKSRRVAANTVAAARGLPALRVPASAWDAPTAEPSLPTTSGLLALDTGTERPYAPRDYVTRTAAASVDVETDPAPPLAYAVDRLTETITAAEANGGTVPGDAYAATLGDVAAAVRDAHRCATAADADARWAGYVAEWFGELGPYVARVIGSALTGRPAEDAVLAIVGPPGAGKSSFTGALENALGDLAGRLDVMRLCVDRLPGGHADDLAALDAARLVITAEPPPGATFGQLANLLCEVGEALPVSAKGGATFTLRPSWRVVMTCNDVPRVAGGHRSGMARRLRVVPIRPRSGAEDSSRRTWLRYDPKAAAAVLRWAVAGYRDYRERGGLDDPPAVRLATSEHVRASDLPAAFAASLPLDPAARVTNDDVLAAWAAFADVNGGAEARRADVLAAVAAVPGVTRTRIRVGADVKRGFAGIALQDKEDRP